VLDSKNPKTNQRIREHRTRFQQAPLCQALKEGQYPGKLLAT
jgi:hypothetical protein